MTTVPNFTILDLFCGTGGLSLGLAKAGFTTVLAVDNNKAALQTYSSNLECQAVELDLSKKVMLPKTTVAEQMQLIGNAIPPLLAQALGQNLVRDLVAAKPVHSEGALLSFIPSVADGVSPALRDVINRVNQQFIHRLIVENHTFNRQRTTDN